MEILLALITILGIVIGSFLNVVVYRVPAGRSIVSPPSACGSCGHAVRRRDNIPVVSWLVLRGRCRDCAAPISARYPLVEAGTGVAFFVVGIAFLPPVMEASSGSQLAAALLALAAVLYLAAVSVALALIDLDTNRLPDVIVLPSYVVGGVLLTASSLLVGEPDALLRAAIALVSLFGLYLVMALAYPGGMGYGDVKLAGVLGMHLGWLGWGSFAVGAFAPFVVGGLFAIGLIVARRAGRKSRIPFGPWMLIGAWIGIFWGEAVFASYLKLFSFA
jgi:leader peptidase (prepilin peptidase)/N-methyltransferase